MDPKGRGMLGGASLSQDQIELDIHLLVQGHPRPSNPRSDESFFLVLTFGVSGAMKRKVVKQPVRFSDDFYIC